MPSPAAVRAPPDGPVGGAVPPGVVEQVGEQLVQPGPVGERRPGPGVDLETYRTGCPASPASAHGVAQERPQPTVGRSGVIPASTRDRSSRSATRPAEPLGLGERGPQRGRVGRGHAVDEVLQHRPQRGDRRAQLVGDVGDQLAPLPVHRGELGRHRVERAGQLADLVPGRRRDPARVVARRHRPGGRGHLAQRRGHPAGEQLGDERGRRPPRPARQRGRRPRRGRRRRSARRRAHGDRHQQAELDLDRAEPVERPRALTAPTSSA